MMSQRPSRCIFGPPIREYDGRRTLRSLADALAKLQEFGGLANGEGVEIKTWGLMLPDGRSTGFLVVIGPSRADGSRWVIRMPSSGRFVACTTRGERQTYDIAVLDNATSDAEGNVRLEDGRLLHRIDFIPAPFLRHLTGIEEAIVEHALEFLGVEDECYRPIHNELPPDVQMLRYDLIWDIRIERLKPVQHHVCRKVPNASPSVVAATLKYVGMRMPRSIA
jgi:hypothetical protein